MGAIQTSIQIHDGMTLALRNMTTALNICLSSFEAVQEASSNVIDTASIDAAREALNETELTIRNIEEDIERTTKQQEKLNDSFRVGQQAAEGLVGKIGGMVAAYATIQTVEAVIDTSDSMVQTMARLELMNDGQQTTQDLFDMIYVSAQNTHAPLMATADAIASMGNNAGAAFDSNAELVAFMEQVNMQFAIGNASAQQQSNALLQLSQAMAAGALRGDELNSILEAAPGIARTIETAMGWAEGSIKSYAEEGQVTAQVVKMSLLAMSDETEQAFNGMDMTFAQTMTDLQNYAMRAFQPVLLRINDIVKSEKFTDFAEETMQAIATLANVALDAFNAMAVAGGFIIDNWSIIEPIVLGIVAALTAYAAVATVVAVVNGAMAASKAFYGAATMLATGSTLSETAAQHGLNAALAACPITWIIVGIIALIAVIFAVCNAIAKMTGIANSGFGVMTGAVLTAGAFIANVVIGVINGLIQHMWTMFVEPFMGIIEWVLNAANGGFDSFGGAVANLIGNIISWFLSLGKVATTIIDAIFGTDWTSGLSDLQNEVLSWGKTEDAITINRDAPELFQRFEYDDAFAAGAAWGDNIAEKIAGFDLADIFGTTEMPGEDDYNSDTDREKIMEQLANIADGTKDISDSLDITEEDLKYLMELGEREAINRFTTAEIKVDLGGVVNQVSSNTDLDGMIDYLAGSLEEQMAVMADGVH